MDTGEDHRRATALLVRVRDETGEDVIDLRDRASADVSDGVDERGRSAASPGEIPAAGWKDIAVRVKDEVKEDQVPLLSAGVAFYAMLALFPALAAIVSVYGLVADPSQVAEQVSDLTAGMPGNARQLLIEQLDGIVSGTDRGIGIALAVGVVLALWSASSGMKHLIGAINVAYDERETRKFLELRGLALALTAGAVLFAALAIGVLAFLPWALEQTPLGEAGRTAVRIASYPALAVAFGVGVAVLYRYGPDRDDPRWSWVTPGAAIATLVWIAASLGFSFYAGNFGSYGETYGSIGAVVVLMLWLVITAFSVVLGAEIDAEIEAQTARDSTVGQGRPMGARGATKADELGEAAAI